MLPILVNKDGCVFTDVWEGGQMSYIPCLTRWWWWWYDTRLMYGRRVLGDATARISHQHQQLPQRAMNTM